MDPILQEAIELIRSGQCEEGMFQMDMLFPDGLSRSEKKEYIFWKGTALQRLSLCDDAERVFRDGIRHYGNEPRFFRAMACLLSDTGREEESLIYFARASQLLPSDPLIPYEWGFALYKLEYDDLAILQFAKALELDPRNRNAVQYLSDIYSSGGRKEDALRVYMDYLSYEPTDCTVLVEAAICLSDLKRYEEAFTLYERAAATDPNDIYSRYDWAVSLWRAGRLQEALEKANECIAVKQDFPLPWMLWGRIALTNRQIEFGLSKLEKGMGLARDADPDDVEMLTWCYESYFEALLEIGRIEDAQAIFWEAARNNIVSASMLKQHNALFKKEVEGLALWCVLLDVRLFDPIPVNELEGDCAAGYFCGYNVLARDPDEALDFALEFQRHLGEGDPAGEEITLIGRNMSGVPGICTVLPDRDYYTARSELSA